MANLFQKRFGLSKCRWSHHDAGQNFNIYFPFTRQCDGWLSQLTSGAIFFQTKTKKKQVNEKMA